MTVMYGFAFSLNVVSFINIITELVYLLRIAHIKIDLFIHQ